MEQGYRIHAMEVMDDHVHLFLEFHPSTSLSDVVQRLKGGSAYRLFRLHPELKKRYWGGNLWSSGKFFRSVGNVTIDTIRHYIEESEVMDDHVHLFLEFHPSTSLSDVVQRLKGGSAYRLFGLHPELKKRYWGGNLWSSGKFFRSVGNVTIDTIRHHIEESQRKPKAESHSSRLKESGQRRLDDF